jgi:hypothetical protein
VRRREAKRPHSVPPFPRAERSPFQNLFFRLSLFLEETFMHSNIKAYLNHHLAASVAGLEALEHLESAEKGTAMAAVLTALRADGAADRHVLEELMTRLKVSESETQKAAAWLGEKVFRALQPLNDKSTGALHLLLTLEALVLGLEGRRAMWLALSIAGQELEALQGIDYQILARRAEDQRERVEKLRVEAARKALRPAG